MGFPFLSVLLGATVFIQYCIFNAVYNVFFHPLRNYPGPRFLGMSQLPIIYAKITGQSSHWALRLHQEYGPVVRLGPNELSYSNPTSWREIYASRSNIRRDPSFYNAFDHKGAPPSLVTATDADHTKIRSAYSRAFSSKAIIKQEPLIAKHVTCMLQKLYDALGQPLDICEILSLVTADIGFDLQFGKSLDLLDDATHRPWVKNHFRLVQSITILGALSEVPLIKTIFQLALPQLIKWARDFHFGWMHQMLEQRLRTATDRPDIVQFVMQQATPERSMSEKELHANLPIILVAQTDTVTSALSGLIAALLNTPDVHLQLKEEIRYSFNCRSDINVKRLGTMKVLNACIKEALRFYPPGAGALPRVVPKEGAMICERWVTGGTRVFTSPLATFRSPANFHEPDSFHPQRWYEDRPKEFASDKPEAWKPYSVGTTDCLGKMMADYLMKLLLCELMLNFDIHPCTESAPWFENQRIWTIWEQKPFMVRLTPVIPLDHLGMRKVPTEINHV